MTERADAGTDGREAASGRPGTLAADRTVVVPGRCGGPPGSGQGGWVAGLLAHRLAARTVTGSLRRPVPLETPFEVVDGQVPSTEVDADGTVPTPLVWAVLDCPGSWALLEGQPRPLEASPALGRITARVDARLRAGAPLAVIGWARSREGRRWEAGTAIVDADGSVLARAVQTCVLVPLDWCDG